MLENINEETSKIFGWILTSMTVFIAAFLKIITSIVGRFFENIVKAQKATDEKVHSNQIDLHTVKLDVAQNYQSKADATMARQEYLKQFELLHARLDTMTNDITNTIRSIAK